jgi:ribosomal protein L32
MQKLTVICQRCGQRHLRNEACNCKLVDAYKNTTVSVSRKFYGTLHR